MHICKLPDMLWGFKLIKVTERYVKQHLKSKPSSIWHEHGGFKVYGLSSKDAGLHIGGQLGPGGCVNLSKLIA